MKAKKLFSQRQDLSCFPNPVSPREGTWLRQAITACGLGVILYGTVQRD